MPTLTPPPDFPRTADCWFLTGPTAAGKTAVGLCLAELLGAEILSLDSMAVYRGLEIGTAKPSPAERARVPHHLLDLAEPQEEYSIAQYLAAAETACAAIRARGRAPLFVGGTPLYLKALLRGLERGPPPDWELRRRLDAETAAHGAAWLHAQVAAVDPAAAQRLHPGDRRRLIRVLEVFHATGQPLSAQQQHFGRAVPAAARRVCVLNWPRDELYRRIDARVEAMFAAGLVAETQAALVAGPLSRTAAQALGYRETLDYLAGRSTLPQTIALVQQRTRQFAKRQWTWFRSLSECRWLDVASGEAAAGDAPHEIARRIVEAVRAGGA